MSTAASGPSQAEGLVGIGRFDPGPVGMERRQRPWRRPCGPACCRRRPELDSSCSFVSLASDRCVNSRCQHVDATSRQCAVTLSTIWQNCSFGASEDLLRSSTIRTRPSPSSVVPSMPGMPASRPSGAFSMTSSRSPSRSTSRPPSWPWRLTTTITLASGRCAPGAAHPAPCRDR